MLILNHITYISFCPLSLQYGWGRCFGEANYSRLVMPSYVQFRRSKTKQKQTTKQNLTPLLSHLYYDLNFVWVKASISLLCIQTLTTGGAATLMLEVFHLYFRFCTFFRNKQVRANITAILFCQMRYSLSL